jgi:PAS domain S-box-containing protein
MDRLRVSSLQWAVGVFFALLGAISLLIPHEILPLAGFWLRVYTLPAGVILFGLGALLAAAAVFAWPRPAVTLIHLLAGLILLAGSLYLTLQVHSLHLWLLLFPALALLLSILSPRLDTRHEHPPANADWLGLSIALSGMALGMDVLVQVLDLSIPYGLSEAAAWLVGLALLLSSGLLLALQFRAQRIGPAAQVKMGNLASLATAAALAAYLSLVVLPNGWWMAGLLVGIDLAALLIFPWLPELAERLPAGSLAARVVIPLLAAVLLPTLVIFSLAADRAEANRLTEALTANRQAATGLARLLNDDLEHRKTELAALAGQPDLFQSGPAELEAQLASFLTAHPGLVALAALSPDGTTLAVAGDLAPVPVTGALDGSPIRFGSVRLASAYAGENLALQLATQSGWLVSTLPSDLLTRRLDAPGNPPGTRVLLLGPQGDPLPGGEPLNPVLLARIRSVQAAGGSFRFTEQDAQSLVGYASLSSPGWTVVIDTPAQSVLAGLNRAREQALALMGVLALVVLAASLALARVIIRPFQAITASLGAMEAGDTTARLPQPGFLEADRMLSAYEALRQQVSNRQHNRDQALDSLRVARKHLEQQLADRSTDLQKLSDQFAVTRESLNAALAEQRWLEAALWESERRLRAVGDSLPAGLWVTDALGNVLYASPTYLQMVGSTLDDLQQFGFTRLLAAPETKPAYKRWMQALRNGEEWEAEFPLQDNRGKFRVLVARARPVRDDKGVITSWVGVQLDLTETRRLERSLAETEDRLRVLLSAAPVMVYTTDEDLRYLTVYNPLPGTNPEDYIGKHDGELIANADLGELTAFKRSVLESRKPARKEVRVCIGGRTLAYDVVAEPRLSRAGQAKGLIVASTDITDRKRLAEELERNTLMIELQHRINDQHEIERIKYSRDLHDGPLQDLIAITFQLQQVIFTATEAHVLEKLQGIQAALQDEVRNLRGFSYALRPPLLSRFGLAKAIESFAETFQSRNPDLKLTINLMEDGQHLPERVRAALFRIVQEGLTNVTRHAHAKEASIRLFFEGGLAILEIQDNGVGFTPPSDWLSLARNGQLGLAGVRERVEALGGSLQVNSKPGEGTCLRVTVPWQREPTSYSF